MIAEDLEKMLMPYYSVVQYYKVCERFLLPLTVIKIVGFLQVRIPLWWRYVQVRNDSPINDIY